MRFYLAGRYGRLHELNDYAEDLCDMGHTVDCVWLRGNHHAEDFQLSDELSTRIAQEDLSDIRACDGLIAFTDPPRSTTSRGGRHAEFGYAMALGKQLIVVGPVENVFYALVDHYPTWSEFLRRSVYGARSWFSLPSNRGGPVNA